MALLETYLFFYGNCEEALKFYEGALGGKIAHITKMADAPEAMQMPGAPPEAVMHSVFQGDGFQFMASDGNPETKATDSNICLSLGFDDDAQAEKVFNALSQGGKVTFQFADAPWGDGKFGSVMDKFNIEWMVVTGQTTQQEQATAGVSAN